MATQAKADEKSEETLSIQRDEEAVNETISAWCISMSFDWLCQLIMSHASWFLAGQWLCGEPFLVIWCPQTREENLEFPRKLILTQR